MDPSQLTVLREKESKKIVLFADSAIPDTPVYDRAVLDMAHGTETIPTYLSIPADQIPDTLENVSLGTLLRDADSAIFSSYLASQGPKESAADYLVEMRNEIVKDNPGYEAHQLAYKFINAAEKKFNVRLSEKDAIEGMECALSPGNNNWEIPIKPWYFRLENTSNQHFAEKIADGFREHGKHPAGEARCANELMSGLEKRMSSQLCPANALTTTLGYLSHYLDGMDDTPDFRLLMNDILHRRLSHIEPSDMTALVAQINDSKQVFSRMNEATKETVKTFNDTLGDRGFEQAVVDATNVMLEIDNNQAGWVAHRSTHNENQLKISQDTDAPELSYTQKR